MENYLDENGTAVSGFYTNMNDKDLTDAINGSKGVAEMKRQNELYASEIKSNRRLNIITLIISSVSAIAAVIAAVASIL